MGRITRRVWGYRMLRILPFTIFKLSCCFRFPTNRIFCVVSTRVCGVGVLGASSHVAQAVVARFEAIFMSLGSEALQAAQLEIAILRSFIDHLVDSGIVEKSVRSSASIGKGGCILGYGGHPKEKAPRCTGHSAKEPSNSLRSR